MFALCRAAMYKGRPISNLVLYEETTLELRFFAWTLLFLNPATTQRCTFLPSVVDLENSFRSRSRVVELKATPVSRHKSRLCLQSDGLSVAYSFQGIETSLRELSQGNIVDVQEVGGCIPLLLPW